MKKRQTEIYILEKKTLLELYLREKETTETYILEKKTQLKLYLREKGIERDIS